MDVGFYAVSIENSQPIEGGRDVQFDILALVQYLEYFVRAAPDNIERKVYSVFSTVFLLLLLLVVAVGCPAAGFG